MVAARLVTTEPGGVGGIRKSNRSIDLLTQPGAAAAINVSLANVKRAQALLATKDTDVIAAVDAQFEARNAG